MLIPFDPQPLEKPYMLDYVSPAGERYWAQAMTQGGGYCETEFYRCPVGDPVDVVQVDGVWFWEVETDR